MKGDIIYLTMIWGYHDRQHKQRYNVMLLVKCEQTLLHLHSPRKGKTIEIFDGHAGLHRGLVSAEFHFIIQGRN